MHRLAEPLVAQILTQADLSIDTRRELGLEPRKLKFKNFFRAQVIYDNETQTLWDFRPWPEFCIKRKKINFSCFRSPDLHVFNMGWDRYDMTIIGAFRFGPRSLSNHLVIREPIKFLN